MTRERALLLAGFAALCACALAIAGRDLDTPGLYYDEVIQAVPAAEFLSAEGTPPRVPGMRSVRVLGRWLPVWTQSYMGALKSQALIPSFALFGATPASLRLTTLAFGLAGVFLCMGFAARLLGPGPALALGALLALDPSFLYVSRHDWGSFALGLVARGGALFGLAAGLAGGRPVAGFLGGLALGLGVYNKLDFALFAAAAGAAAALAAPRELRALLGPRRRDLLPALAGAAAGAAPVLAALPAALRTTRAFARSTGGEPGAWSEKLFTLTTLLDGSYFERLVRAGGSFERLPEATGAATSPFPWILAGALLFLAVRVGAGLRRGRARPVERFALAAPVLLTLALLATPRATRIHHWGNLYPLAQLAVAAALAAAWRLRDGAAARGARAAALALLALALAGHVRVDLHTARTLAETGGKGRWSDALGAFAAELGPESVVVSLDWGFHAPLRFLRPDAALVEPVWRLRSPRAGWRFEGDERVTYLLYPEELAVFGYGASFRAALRDLPPDLVHVRRHRDRQGDVAFLSVHLSAPHRLVYRGGFQVMVVPPKGEPAP